ncbi:MAG: helix-turn-helix domain-containing protein [Solirubrobacteraceae bacterium]
MPGPSAQEIVLQESERKELEHRAACYSRPHREVLRAKLVLLAADGHANAEIAQRLGMNTRVVSQWRRRFAADRLAGLADQARSGRPRRFPPGADRRGQGGRVPAAGHGRAAVAAVSR